MGDRREGNVASLPCFRAVRILPFILFMLWLSIPAWGQVVITELMYHPPDAAGSDAEFLELTNTGSAAVSLEGWCFRGITFCFGPGVNLGAGQRVVLTADHEAFETAWGFAADYEFGGGLSNSGEKIQLLDAAGGVVDLVDYRDVWPWPVTPDGLGPSLEVIDPREDNNTPRNWRASVDPSGHTAGRPNSVRAQGLPAWIQEVTHTVSPAPGAPFRVTARILDAAFVDFAFRTDFGEETFWNLNDDGVDGDEAAGDGLYSVLVPGRPAGRLLRYRITATAANGGAMDYPRLDDTVVYAGTVVQDPASESQIPRFEWFIEPSRYQAALDHALTDETEPAVLAFQGRIWDNVRVRVRGGSARWWPKLHWKFILPQGHDFEAPGLLARPVDRFNLQGSYGDKTYLREILSYESFQAAGVASNQVFHVRLHQNGQFFGLYVFLEQPDDDWFARHGLDENGAHYKAYAQAEAVGSEAELHWMYEKESREDEDFTDLFEFLKGINQPDPRLRREYLFDHVDLPGMLNYLAVQAIIHNNDHVAKNYYLYCDTEGTGRWTMYPWDMDLTFGRNYLGEPDQEWGLVLNDTMWADVDRIRQRPLVSPSHPLFGDRRHQKWDYLWNRLIDALLQEPDFREMYFRRLRTLMDELLAPGRYEARIDELAARIQTEAALDRARWGQYGTPQTLDQAIRDLKEGYLLPRRVHLFETHRVPGEIPDSQQAAATVRITEVMYQPPGGNRDEFIELFNPSWDDAVDLSGWVLEGADVTLPPGTVLVSRGYLVLVRNDPAYRQTYGPGLYVPARFGRNLDDSGQELVLKDVSGRVVDRIGWGTGPEWPAAARGAGASLERLEDEGDATQPAAWSAGPAGGTPGRPNRSGWQPAQRLLLPLSSVPSATFTGLAVSHPGGTEELRLEFRAWSPEGQVHPAPHNPAVTTVAPGAQLAMLAEELLGASVRGAWIEVLAGGKTFGSLAQIGGPRFLDGFVAQTSPARELYLSQVCSGSQALRGRAASTLVAVANPNAGPARVRLSLMPGDGGPPLGVLEQELAGLGMWSGEVGALFGRTVPETSYLKIEVVDGGGVTAAGAVWLEASGTLIGLNAQPRNAASELFSAQLAVSPGIFTQLKLINVSSGQRTLRLTPVAEDGTGMVPPLVRSLQPGQVLLVDGGRDFGLQSSSTVVGSVHVETDRPGILGDVLFGEPGRIAFAASLPLQGSGYRSAVFSQVANLGDFFTGLALFNPGPGKAEITLEVFTREGEFAGRRVLTLRAGERISNLLVGLVPETAGQVRGYIVLASSEPVMAQELFGTGDLQLLSSVPVQ
ncbi:MAG: hypothetical protein Kow001_02990 [Acidobacteriota bacterium]